MRSRTWIGIALLLWASLAASGVQAEWVQVGFDIDGEAAFDSSGCSVALSADGSRVAVGAYTNDGNGGLSGHVRVYDWNGGTWIQVGADLDGEAADDRSGCSVVLSANGSRVAIGAKKNDGKGSNSGHVRVYDWNSVVWIQAGSDIDGESAGDNSGSSVALSSDGSRLAIGAQVNDGGGSTSGHVRIYDWDGGAWVQAGMDIDGEAAGDYSGCSVALSSDGSRVAIGADGNDHGGSSSGHVRVYDWSGGAWVQAGQDIDGEAANADSGYSVALSVDGNRVAIGAPGNGDEAGQVRVYDWSGGAWVQAGQDIDGEAVDDYSGYAVALSSDGSRVAIGARANDGNGDAAGHVRVYDWSGGWWIQAGLDIDGESADDRSGCSVALSSDGSLVAIGARDNDGNGSDSGHVRVHGEDFPTPLPTMIPSLTPTRTPTVTPTLTPTAEPTPTELPGFTAWEPVGPPGFTVGEIDNTGLALDSNGIPYVVFKDHALSGGATVMRFNGTSWETVGSPDFTPGEASDIGLALDSNDVPYVAFSDAANGGGATAMRFNGSSWEIIGSPGFSVGGAWYTCLAIDGNDVPHVAFSDHLNPVYRRPTVKRFNGTDWEPVGEPGFTYHGAHGLSLAIIDIDTPFLAFDGCMCGDPYCLGAANAMYFDGEEWDSFGQVEFSDGRIGRTHLVSRLYSHYVAFSDIENGGCATVMKYSSMHGWQCVGTAGFSEAAVYGPKLALDSHGTAHVAYSDGAVQDRLAVRRFDGSSWVPVGSQFASVNGTDHPCLAISGDDAFYVLFRDEANGGRATVMRYDPPDVPALSGFGLVAILAMLSFLIQVATRRPHL